ncbi:vomeronasal type-1 receptor 3-like [Vicugna pacos]|uniref:Vomeronasal type-1 receptor n=1 Tax=Vicugna pacos TaxID=30538 RepID=A0ABM5DNK9_VICPA
MFPSDTVLGVFFVSQICMGFMGNSMLFFLYMYSFLIQSPLKRPIDLIFIHLTFVNILTIMFKLIPDLVSSFGVRHFLDDVGCKVTLFVYRVTRGLSICTTALLSAFQAITISPSQHNWVRLKSKFSTCIYPSFFFFWIINTLIYVDITKNLRANHNFTIAPSGYSQIYCQSKQTEQHHLMAFLSVILIRDLLCVVFMMLSSIYMVNLLYKHHQRAQCIHSPNVSSQPSPEIKATHTILLLVSCFVFFYCLNNFLTLYLIYRQNPRLERMTGIIASCYPTICPFMLMKNNNIISKLTFSLLKMRINFSQGSFKR